MKRTLAYALAAALLAACSTQEKDFQTPAQDDAVFYASFERPTEPGTKVYATEDLYLRWNADDRVSIFNRYTYNQEYRFNGETGDNSGSFKKVDNGDFVTGNYLDNIYAVYPYLESTRISETGVVSVSLPAEQQYAENTFGPGANTMVSATVDNQLLFKNVGGYLVLKLYGDGVAVSSITLKGNNGEKLAGKASVSMPIDGVPTAVMADNASTEITLTCPTPVPLGATAEESTQFWIVVPPVMLDKGFTVSVTKTSGDVFKKSTSRSITIERNIMSKMSPMRVSSIPVPEAVDLGLPSGLKWASFNMGASKPEEYGDYYAWGETEPYYSSQDPLLWKPEKESGYFWPSSRWHNGDYDKLTKYCPTDKADYWAGSELPDGKTELDPDDDAARVNLDGKWRMPTDAEWAELRENCTWAQTTQNGAKGILITASNGNNIFLPAAGWWYKTDFREMEEIGYYWSSTVDVNEPARAWSRNTNTYSGRNNGRRYLGFSVRPVYGDPAVSVESISLNKTSLELFLDDSFSLIATVLPENSTYKNVEWSSSDELVATVSITGVVTGLMPGSAVITATTVDGRKHATCNVTVRTVTVPVPEMIDLDLPSGLKWASFNLGASKPEEAGDYYAWGETEPKQDYSWETYRCNKNKGSDITLTKYNTMSDYGAVDNKTVLDLEDDAAHVNLGGNWRMPTDAEWTELRNNCTWTWTTQNGVNGYWVTSKKTGDTDKSIFLPAAGGRYNADLNGVGGYGNYWSSSLGTDSPLTAWNVTFSSGSIDRYNHYRWFGFSVRPVSE